jgi:hypothetical protein
MAGDGGLNTLSLLPENVLPQWQQKIADAENTPCPYYVGGRRIFRTKCDFLQVLDLLIFRQPGTAIDASAAAIFTLLSM